MGALVHAAATVAPEAATLDDDAAGGRPQKSSTAFRTISEVAEDLDVAQHVLRFWESKFPQVRPLKRGGGRRYYRPEDVELLRQIRSLLYEEGYTIKGAQKLLRARRGGGRGAAAAAAAADVTPASAASSAAATATAAAPRVAPAPAAAPTPPRAVPQPLLDERRRLKALRSELAEIRALLTRARAELLS
jgi:DNA-binding transcriptional MerR regulator